MKLIPYSKGRDLQAFALVTGDGQCPAVTFLNRLDSNPKARAYGERIVAALQKLLDNRGFRNPDLIEKIAGYENLFAITPNKARLLMGYAPNGTVLLSVGYMKNEMGGKTAKTYYREAVSMQKQAISEHFPAESKNDERNDQLGRTRKANRGKARYTRRTKGA